MPRPTPPTASGTCRAKTPASAELGPAVGVDGHGSSLAGPQPLEGEAARRTDHARCRPGRPRPRRARSPRSPQPFGRPRMRSAMMLRWICEVPAAMVREKPCTHVLTSSALPSGPVVRRAPSSSSHGQAGAARADPCRTRRCAGAAPRGQLVDAAADPGHAGARRLRDVAARQRPQGVELGARGGPMRRRTSPSRPRAGAPGQATQGAQQLHGLEHLADEGGAALEAQGDHGDPPAVVLLAHPVGHRHPHAVEEQLAELGRAGDGAQRAEVDPRPVHGQDQPGDAAVAAVLGPGAHEQLAEVGHLGVRRPDLRAGDHVLVAVAHRPGAQRRQVAARRRARRSPGTRPRRRAGWAGGTGPAARGSPRPRSSGPACRRPTKFTPT